METIIFNKNHVTVTSEQIPKHSSSIGKYRVAWTTEWETIYPKGMTITTLKKRNEDVIKESPLGFYYDSVEEVEYEGKMVPRFQKVDNAGE